MWVFDCAGGGSAPPTAALPMGQPIVHMCICGGHRHAHRTGRQTKAAGPTGGAPPTRSLECQSKGAGKASPRRPGDRRPTHSQGLGLPCGRRRPLTSRF